MRQLSRKVSADHFYNASITALASAMFISAGHAQQPTKRGASLPTNTNALHQAPSIAPSIESLNLQPLQPNGLPNSQGAP